MEKILHEWKEQIDQAENYLQYRDYHKAYKQTEPNKQEKYAERYRTELVLYDRAEQYLKEHLGSDIILLIPRLRGDETLKNFYNSC